METLSHQATVATTATKTSSVENPIWEKIEFNRFGMVPLILTIVGIFGGIAAASVLSAHGSLLIVGLVALSTVVPLSLILAVAPMKAIVRTSSVAVVLQIIIAAAFLLIG